MSRPLLPVLKYLLSVALMTGCLPAAMAASTPTLFSMASGNAEVLARGAQKSWPIKVSEDNAFDAVFQGGMWLPNPAGGRIYAKYQRHVMHANGTWSWIGTVETVHGEQPVVLTFGSDKSVFGLIPQASGYPLRIVSNARGTHVVETSATVMAQSAEALRLHSAPDYVIPPKVNPKSGALTTTAPRVAAATPVPVQAAASGPVTIDVMVAYTPGFVTEVGTQARALARIQNLVDTTNAAYTASGVTQQIRLVYTVQVNYPDNTSNQSALDDITGINENGGTVPVPASLQNIASLRDQYGADLVTLIRSYDNATQGGCGVGWLIGGNMTQIVPSQQKPYGYSVVSDGSNGGYFCLDTTFAHELGHNMGSAHDRANATEPGAYSYSYGYLGNGAGGGFSTIMAYGTTSDTPLSMFSNPNLSTCLNSPCGVADSLSNSADNAHSMNNTAALIAAFEPTMVSTVPVTETVHNDITGSGKSALLWYNATAHRFSYWAMNGATIASWQGFDVPTGYQPIGTGDFDGNGYVDILWQSPSGGLYMWLSNGSSFTSQYVGAYPIGYVLAGTADVNNDGKTDLIWYNPTIGRASYWLMNGASMISWQGFWTNTGLKALATGNFDGNGDSDIIWLTPSGTMVMWIFNSSGNFNYYNMGASPGGDWVLAGTGDVNGDGKTDLFWYSPSMGRMSYWLMNGPSVQSWQGFWTNTGLTPLASGTFDGTSACLTWEMPGGNMAMWLFNVFNGALSYYSFAAYPGTGWVPIP